MVSLIFLLTNCDSETLVSFFYNTGIILYALKCLKSGLRIGHGVAGIDGDQFKLGFILLEFLALEIACTCGITGLIILIFLVRLAGGF